MSIGKLLCAEIWHRKLNVALSLFALAIAATLFVTGPTLLQGYQVESQRRLAAMQLETEQELIALQTRTQQQLSQLDTDTKRVMRDLGFNLRIVHRDTDLDQLYANFVSFDMPEEYVTRLANSNAVTKVAHLVASLRQKIEWQGKQRLVVGFAPEATQSHAEKKSPMGLRIERGTVVLGSLVGAGHVVGDQIEVLGKSLEVAAILPEHGRAEEDIAICMHLADAQELLQKPGKISEILALGCKCQTANRAEELMAQLEAVLPEAKVTEQRLSAIAREDQRKLVERHNSRLIQDYAANRADIMQQEQEHRAGMAASLSKVSAILTPVIVLACGLWVGLLAWSNVRERRTEIGLLRALGKSSFDVAGLFLGKAMLLGLMSGVIGCALGYGLARWLAASLLAAAAADFTPPLFAVASVLIGTPLVAILASYLPTLAAVRQDPAVVLSEA